jgi:DNA-binding GntR family transcriptional regulator
VLQLASGEYFMWAQHDDCWSMNYIGTLLERLLACPRAVLAAGRTLYIDVHGNPSHLDPDDAPVHHGNGNLSTAKQLLQQHAQGWLHGLFRRDELLSLVPTFFAADPWGADIVFVLELCLNKEIVGSDKVSLRILYALREDSGQGARKKRNQRECDHCEQQVRGAILNGNLAAGQRIVERTIAAEFGASLTSVREAIIQLESEGFITKKPNASTYVTQLSLPEAEKIFAVRRVLEEFAIQEAARLATPEDVAALQRLHMAMIDSAREENGKLLIQKDFDFHEGIWKISGNEYLVWSLRRTVLPLFAFSAIRFAATRSFDLLQDAYSHLPLVNAIQAKDSDLAVKELARAMEVWLKQAREYVNA